jgi:hypothetical protein
LSILVQLLGIFTDLTPDILDIYIDLFGLDCDIYLESSATQEYRLYDDHAKITYSNTPDRSEKLLIVNFIRGDAMRSSLGQFESFFDEDRPFILSYEAKRLPPRTKIHAYFNGSKMSFQTEIDSVITGAKSPQGDNRDTILVKQLLRPLT